MTYVWTASVGDVNTDRPGLLDFVGKAKWRVPLTVHVAYRLLADLSCFRRDAWKSVEGTSKEEAMKVYVDKLVEVCSQFSRRLNPRLNSFKVSREDGH